jgi:uncharacterized membrane protein YgcG
MGVANLALWACFVALCVSCIALAPAQAAQHTHDRIERIVSFRSDISVERDGTIRARETITINAQLNEIKRGIFRDFPTIYPDGVHVAFEVVSVKRDGQDEHYALESLDNGVRVRIGNAAVLLDPGYHLFEIEYTTDRQLAFFETFDEFYWNVTGNAWQFRIDEAEATVHLPPGARIIKHAFYTGAQGAKGQAARAIPVDDNTIVFRTTEILGANEGLTIGVGFSKNAVAEPTAEDRLWYFLRDHTVLGAFAIGLVVLFGYFGVVWVLGGRDPPGGTIVPSFEPPEGLSPASLRYVERMGYDSKMFSANLLAMAAKGFLTVKTNENDTYTLKRTGKSAKEARLAPDESEIARELFAHGDNTVPLVQASHKQVSKAIGALTRWLSLHFDNGYVLGNWSLFWPGLIIAALTTIAIIWFSDDGFGALGMILWVTVSAAGAFAFGLGCIASWKDVLWPSHGNKGSLFLAIMLLLPFAAFTAMTIGAMFFVFDRVPWYTPVLVWVLIVALFVFRRLLKAPTIEGAKLLTAIKGFRLFLTTAEENRLRELNPPQVTPQLFERFLPYAIALDCELAWGKKFEADATRAGMTPAQIQSYQPVWYSSTSSHDFSSSTFASSVGSALATATASASVSPSSTSYSSGSSSSSFSSGSSGGGSSGGGGGGGGGGGW